MHVGEPRWEGHVDIGAAPALGRKVGERGPPDELPVDRPGGKDAGLHLHEERIIGAEAVGGGAALVPEHVGLAAREELVEGPPAGTDGSQVRRSGPGAVGGGREGRGVRGGRVDGVVRRLG